MNDDHKISFSIDRSKVRQAFKEYTSHYDQQNPRISLKIRHTYRVADLTDRITGSLGLTAPDRDLAWLIGILHDIGRFEQERIYHTLNDAKSTNHARLGADLLFKEDLIDSFVSVSQPVAALALIEKAVRLHNVLDLPKALTDRERLFCQIIRDADKVDIMWIMCVTPVEEIMKVSREDFLNSPISPAVYEDIMAGRIVDRSKMRTVMDVRVSHLAFVNGLVYPESRKLVKEQGTLKGLLEDRTSVV